MEEDTSPRDGVRVGRSTADTAPAARAGVAIGFGSPANDSG